MFVLNGYKGITHRILYKNELLNTQTETWFHLKDSFDTLKYIAFSDKLN